MPYKKNTPHSLKGKTKLYCIICNKEYYRTPSGSLNSKYCSRLCKNKNNNKIKEKHWNWKGGLIEKRCLLCNSITYKHKCHLKLQNNIFCSNKCKMIFYKSKQKTKNTNIEKIVKNILDKNKIKYQEQKRIHNICIADFFIKEKNILIFCDGNYWHNFPYGKPRDSQQIQDVNNLGYKGLRFWGSEILKDDFEDKLLLKIK